MRRMVLASHGHLAQGMKETAEMILGEQKNLTVLSGYTEECANVKESIRILLEERKEDDELIVLTDIFGGSINNEFLQQLETHTFHLVAGMNLPLVIELLEAGEEEDIKELLNSINNPGNSFIKYCNPVLEEKATADEEF